IRTIIHGASALVRGASAWRALVRDDLEVCGVQNEPAVARPVRIGEQTDRLLSYGAIGLGRDEALERDQRAIGPLPERQPLGNRIEREGEGSVREHDR